MKCPDCGREMEEGVLYCPGCGKEIFMVPDFEPEIEMTMGDVLEDITSDLKAEDAKEKQEIRQKKGQKISVFCSIAAVVCLTACLGAGIVLNTRTESAETKMEKAGAAAEKGNLEKAIEYTLQAVEMEHGNTQIRNTLGRYYLQDGQIKNAKTTFEDIIAMDSENEQAYEGLISVYEKYMDVPDYEAIERLVCSSNSAKIRNEFTRYLANVPEFSVPQGTYEEIISLKITANTTGTVYYTLDGSEPGTESEIYKGSILLEDGIYTVQAIFINDFGICSETGKAIYQIHLNQAHEPEVEPKNGVYTSPEMIVVSVPDEERVYYTVDGSMSTQDSIPYNSPLLMPLGDSTYKFVSYSEDGDFSEPVTRNYTFSFQSALDIQDAVGLLLMGLVDRGVILDLSGAVQDKGGKNLYICSTVLSINGNNYFLVVEYYEDPAMVRTKTENMYCVDTENGQLFKAVVDSRGYYSVVSF